MRGFGVTMASFATEVQMDKIAELVGLDPWTVRFRNAYPERRHQAAPQGRRWTSTLIETMQAAAELVGVTSWRRSCWR